jgi:outer membrane protein FlgP
LSPLSYKESQMKRTVISVLVLSMVALTGCKSINLSMPVTSRDASSMVPPVVEKRETITATGYAVVTVQNHKNPAQQRLMAIRASKLDAYRNLTEQVYGQQLDASSTVADMVVTNDTFRTKVEGVIYGARLVSITPVGEDTYETTLSLDRDVVQDLRIMYMGQVAAKGR